MTVSVDAVAVELARPTPSGQQAAQWQSWIDRAYRLVQTHLGDTKYAALDLTLLDDVVLTAVAEHVRAWRDTTATQYTVSVDDGSTTRRYEASAGPLSIPDYLWPVLDPTVTDGGAFSVTPGFEPDTAPVESWL